MKKMKLFIITFLLLTVYCTAQSDTCGTNSNGFPTACQTDYTNAQLELIKAHVDSLESYLNAVKNYVDNLEALQQETIDSIANISVSVSGGDASAANQVVTQGYVDGVEMLLTSLNGYVDDLETTNGNVSTTLSNIYNELQAKADPAESQYVLIQNDSTKVYGNITATLSDTLTIAQESGQSLNTKTGSATFPSMFDQGDQALTSSYAQLSFGAEVRKILIINDGADADDLWIANAASPASNKELIIYGIAGQDIIELDYHSTDIYIKYGTIGSAFNYRIIAFF